MLDLEKFIYENVVKREGSLFFPDIKFNGKEIKKAVSNRSVLVIGGAGSIGSSFIMAILQFSPASLVVVDTNENGLTELTRDLRSRKDVLIPMQYIPYPMDYSSPAFKRMFKAHGGFDIVANFSAHKHVRSEKDIFSVEALLRNNVINAKGLLDLLSDYPPNIYFCVSTDKAANPVNIMGASKRIMEDLIFSYSDRFPVKTARFANVAFSNGSLPAGFLERIRKQQPISAPSDVKRYFVSPEESGQICLLSCVLGHNREIFFPKLKKEQMMTFDEIARKLIECYGYNVLECESDVEAMGRAKELKEGGIFYPVHFSRSDTSGEKQYEEFYTDAEIVDMDRFLALGVITDKKIPDRKSVDDLVKNLDMAFGRYSATKEEVVKIIQSYLPYFEHIETGKSLDGKM